MANSDFRKKISWPATARRLLAKKNPKKGFFSRCECLPTQRSSRRKKKQGGRAATAHSACVSETRPTWAQIWVVLRRPVSAPLRAIPRGTQLRPASCSWRV